MSDIPKTVPPKNIFFRYSNWTRGFPCLFFINLRCEIFYSKRKELVIMYTIININILSKFHGISTIMYINIL